ncbi:MAG: hypothetical protein ACO23V_11910, partial [Chitinophagaceae bacterium]
KREVAFYRNKSEILQQELLQTQEALQFVHHRSDFSRLIYKQAYRLANFAVENRISKKYTNQYSTTGELQLSLKYYPNPNNIQIIDEDKPPGIREEHVVDSLEDIFRNLCYHLDLECPKYVFNSLEYIDEKMSQMEEEYAEKRRKIQSRIDELNSDENAEKVN